MDNFAGKIAVVTGGGTGMGRELCLELVKAGCTVAACDVLMDNLEETKALCQEAAPDIKITLHKADVSSEKEMTAFRDEVIAEHGDTIHLLFNNAGIAGGGIFNEDENREEWERTFGVCWYGVYYGCRLFMPLMEKADEGHIINTSSINGFWATVGPSTPHTAYCAAKFAVKGFTEALIVDLRMSMPHVKCSVVMPGHIGTSIAINSGKVHGNPAALEMSDDDVRELREQMMQAGGPMSEQVMNLSDDQIRQYIHERGESFRDDAPTTANQAAHIILDGVKAGKWRILVGEDAHNIDKLVRSDPESAYEESFLEMIMSGGDLQNLVAATE